MVIVNTSTYKNMIIVNTFINTVRYNFSAVLTILKGKVTWGVMRMCSVMTLSSEECANWIDGNSR